MASRNSNAGSGRPTARPVYSHTPGSGRPTAPERTELSQAFGQQPRQVQRAIPAAPAATTTSARPAPGVSGGGGSAEAAYPAIEIDCPAGFTVNGNAVDVEGGAHPVFSLAFPTTALLFKGDSAGGIAAATPGTDYALAWTFQDGSGANYVIDGVTITTIVFQGFSVSLNSTTKTLTITGISG